MWIRGGLFLAVAVLGAVTGCHRPTAGDRLNDEAALLPPSGEERIAAFQSSLLSDYDVELAVDIPKDSPPDLEAYAHRSMQDKRIGVRTGAARGVLLLIDVNREVVRLEVGSDLEHVLPDAFVSRIERNQMAPFFREGRVGDGIEATV
ncbi:MAG: TPM domain-containing protein, partial [Rhodothermales bacterium]|nr:TPM domain-containing protein [Rhodothermales bacterium]